MIGVVLCGACGRMGRAIVRETVRSRDIRLVAATEAPGSPMIGRDAGEVAGVGRIGVAVAGAGELERLIDEARPDVLVDFTVAEAAVENVRVAAGRGVQVVVGTTGFRAEQVEEMRRIVESSGITAIVSPNMAVGVNVLFELVERAARLLGPGYSAEVVEIHHEGKLDSPSGTALQIAEILSRGMGGLEVIAGRRANERRKGIYVHSLRLGDVVGEHTVVFAGGGERIEITHRAHGREAFASGVLRAVRYAFEHRGMGKICDMRDVLGLR
jgi:4-hydroxy-tetrahydrodipicolinate reductase